MENILEGSKRGSRMFNRRLIKIMEMAQVKEGTNNLLMGTKLALLDASVVVP